MFNTLQPSVEMRVNFPLTRTRKSFPRPPRKELHIDCTRKELAGFFRLLHSALGAAIGASQTISALSIHEEIIAIGLISEPIPETIGKQPTLAALVLSWEAMRF